MKTILMLVASAAMLSACAASGPRTAWGKPNISKVDYVTDLGTCSALSAMAEASNGANTAGGLNGKNGAAPPSNQGEAAKSAGQSGGPPVGTAVPVGGGGAYRDSAPADVVNRAANQQQTQQMTAQRLRSEALKSCYVERGYQEFTLTPEQRQRLGALKKGTNEYLQYLAEIGTDPAVADRMVAGKPGS
jgi:hypothetical protein